jgi:Protein of unknown function (DUF4231)
MDESPTDAFLGRDRAGREAAAEERFHHQLDWYEVHARRNRICWQVFQTATIVLGGLTPVLVLWSNVPKPLQALPAALASISAGLAGVFGWRDDWIRFAHTAEALKTERTLLTTRTGPRYARAIDDDRALENFVEAIEALASSEVSEWRSRLVSGLMLPEQDGADIASARTASADPPESA